MRHDPTIRHNTVHLLHDRDVNPVTLNFFLFVIPTTG